MKLQLLKDSLGPVINLKPQLHLPAHENVATLGLLPLVIPLAVIGSIILFRAKHSPAPAFDYMVGAACIGVSFGITIFSH